MGKPTREELSRPSHLVTKTKKTKKQEQVALETYEERNVKSSAVITAEPNMEIQRTIAPLWSQSPMSNHFKAFLQAANDSKVYELTDPRPDLLCNTAKWYPRVVVKQLKKEASSSSTTRICLQVTGRAKVLRYELP